MIRRYSLIFFSLFSFVVIFSNVAIAQNAEEGDLSEIAETIVGLTNDVNAFTLLLIAWVLTSIIYFGGGLWERTNEQKERKEADNRSDKNLEKFQSISERFINLAEKFPERIEALEEVAQKNSELIERQVNLWKIEKDNMKRGFSATLKTQKEEHGRILETINNNFDKFIDGIGDKFSKAIMDGQIKVAQILSDKFTKELGTISTELHEIRKRIDISLLSPSEHNHNEIPFEDDYAGVEDIDLSDED